MAAVLMSLILVAACGQKGPLYLPGDPSQIKTDVPNQGNTPEQQTDGDSEEDSDDEEEDDS